MVIKTDFRSVKAWDESFQMSDPGWKKEISKKNEKE